MYELLTGRLRRVKRPNVVLIKQREDSITDSIVLKFMLNTTSYVTDYFIS